MEEWKKTTSHEEMKKQGKQLGGQMGEWSKKNAKSFVDQGQPLGKTKMVSKNGIADSRNDLNYYCVVEAESHDAAAKLFSDNPHIQTIPDSTIDVIEIPHRGM